MDDSLDSFIYSIAKSKGRSNRHIVTDRLYIVKALTFREDQGKTIQFKRKEDYFFAPCFMQPETTINKDAGT